MKTSTLVSLLTLSLVSTTALASALPPDDCSEPVSAATSRQPRSTRGTRFRKQAARIPVESEAHIFGQIPSSTLGQSGIGPRYSDAGPLSSVLTTPLSPNLALPLQRRHMVRKQASDISPGTIANPALQKVDTMSKTDADSMSFSAENLALIETTTDLLHSTEATPVLKAKRDEDEDITDIKYLNYALVIEQLLHAYYLEALRRFSVDDFRNAGFPDWIRGRFKEMAEHERTHKEFLESAIVAAGSDHVRPANYDFGDQDLSSFIDTSMGLESIATSAYIGALQFFSNKAYVTAEAAMLADRARQAAWINSAVRKQNPWNTAFETPLTPRQVFTLLSIFFNDETSPESNKALLPTGMESFPRLELSPRLVPGEQAEISFPYPGSRDGEPSFFYVAFMSGVETIFGHVLDREEEQDDGQTRKRYFVEIPTDLVSRGVVYVIVLKGNTEEIGDVRIDDESMVAGPAISMFPFDADGKAI